MGAYPAGYFRFPTVHEDAIVFVSENDLWKASVKGGLASRLTSNLGGVAHPHFSDDGQWLAFTGTEEGAPEVYYMPASGGPAARLTFLGAMTYVVGWHEGKIVFASDAGQPFMGQFFLYIVDPFTADISPLDYGPASHISWGASGVVLGRNTADPARWKRYRGGRAGKLWIDKDGSGTFIRLRKLEAGNITTPLWIGERIYFISDQSGFGNLHSCTPDGKDLKQHTRHRKYFARNADTDGERIVYQNGADIYSYELKTGKGAAVEIQFPSPRVQLHRKYIPSQNNLESYALNSDGSRLAVVSRGKAFVMADWEGSVQQLGWRQGARYRLLVWTPEGKSILLSSDKDGEDHLEIHPIDTTEAVQNFNDVKFGRPQIVKLSPKGGKAVVVNHRHEVVVVDLEKRTAEVIDRNEYIPIGGIDWSPDGRWLAYGISPGYNQMVIRLYNLETGEKTDATKTVLVDFNPRFDPEGKYLYFISSRVFDPVRDNMHFDYNFPRGESLYLITLRKDLNSPFVPEAKGFGTTPDNGKEKENKESAKAEAKEGGGEPETKTSGDEDKKSDDSAPPKKDEKPEDKPLVIDLDGIQERIVAFPISEGIYNNLEVTKDRIFYEMYPVEGAMARSWANVTPEPKAVLKVFDISKQEEGVFVSGITSYTLSANGAALAYRKADRLRVVDAKRDPKQELPKEDAPCRKNGWIDFARIKLAVEPVAEWTQMLKEAWRLQRDYFWVEDMSDVDWKKVLDRYLPLVERVGCREEFSDLMWEMQGELGTSHAYELGGDYRPHPNYQVGFLGAKFEYDAKADAYRIAEIGRGDTWDNGRMPPLKRPGVNVSEGMLLLKVNGERADRQHPPSQLLVNLANCEVNLEVADADRGNPRTVTVKALSSETPIWYRDWVESNRDFVHAQSGGRIGYVHVPNMSPGGYAEFHRYYLTECYYDGLIVDVRHNGGGHVSPLLIEKLARKRIGYTRTRWMKEEPTPGDSPPAAMVALTNENAGSDGDIFSHTFKLLKLGKLIGTRTWGGVIGIWPRNWLVDGTITTQPEFSHWYADVGYGVENYGTEPDIEVEITPQDWRDGRDAQLERGIAEVLKMLKENPPQPPDLEKSRKKLALP